MICHSFFDFILPQTPLLKNKSRLLAQTESFEIIVQLINFKLKLSEWHWKAGH